MIVEFVSVRENADDKTRKEYSKALQALQDPELKQIQLSTKKLQPRKYKLARFSAVATIAQTRCYNL